MYMKLYYKLEVATQIMLAYNLLMLKLNFSSCCGQDTKLERPSMNRRVSGSIPDQKQPITWVAGSLPTPHQGMRGKQPIDVSHTTMFPSLTLPPSLSSTVSGKAKEKNILR